MTANRPTSLIGGVRHAWSLPRYAGEFRRWWWVMMGTLIFAQIVWPMVVVFALDIRRSPWFIVTIMAPNTILLVGIPALFWRRARVERSLQHALPCPGCGYDIADNDACPECGLALCIEDRKQAWRDAGYEVR